MIKEEENIFIESAVDTKLVNGIILAAGKSGRFGDFKLLFNFKGRTIIERSIESMYNVCSKIICVTGFNKNLIEEQIKKYSKVISVYNENYNNGMLLSLKKALKHITSDRFFILPADMPFISEVTYKSLLEINAPIVIPQYENKKGHPVLLRKECIPEIMEYDTSQSLSQYIKQKGFSLINTNDENILNDIDTLDDFNKLKNIYYES